MDPRSGSPSLSSGRPEAGPWLTWPGRRHLNAAGGGAGFRAQLRLIVRLNRGDDDRGVCRGGALSKSGGIMKPAAARNRALRCSIQAGLTLIDNGGLVPDTDG